MRMIWIIFKRELNRYFTSLIPYIVASSFLFLTGVSFYSDLTFSVTTRPIDPAAIPTFLALALVFFAPMLTMRAVAEEKREGTMELLLTAPVTDTAIVIGKFLAAWTYYTLLLMITLSYQYMLVFFMQQPDLGHANAAYIGIWLYGGAAIAIGIMFSATTENQIVAAFLSSSTLIIFYLGSLVGEVVPNIELANLLRILSFQGHFSTSFAVGIIRLEDLTYFVGVIIFALFISTRAVEAQRIN
ncbi:MAG: ABC transporter permease [Chloroflexota bacterium]